MRFFHTFQVLIFGLLVFSGLAADSSAVRDRHVEAELILELEHVVPGQTVWAGLRLNHDPEWHTYWKASATGYATSLTDISGSDRLMVGEFLWPAPDPYYFEGYIEYVYEHEVVIPFELTVAADAEPGSSLEFRATADWLMCRTVCIPGQVDLVLSIPVREEAGETDPRWHDLFAEARRLQPGSTSGRIEAWREGNRIFLEVPAPKSPESIYYFDEQSFIVATMETSFQPVEGDRLRLDFQVDPAGVGDVEVLKGVLRTADGWPDGSGPVWRIEVPLGTAPATGLTAGASVSLWWTLVLAFLGGLILNLMPCVFPVLGIKIMGFVKQAGSDRLKVVSHGLVFTAGVLVSFWVLTAFLLILRSGGQELGWGFQLQSAPFVYFLTLILFLFGLNMSGLFEVGQSAVGVGSGLTAKSGYSGSFFSGVLATVVATPCAAPFLAPAIGAALALPPVTSILVFTSVALGLAAPYTLMSAFPQSVKLLPRPGAWMETFKQSMSFLLYATVGYLVWVLAGQLTDAAGYSPFSLLWVFFSLVVVAIAAWTYGRWGDWSRRVSVRYRAYGIATVLLVGGIWMGYPQPVYDAGPEGNQVTWQTWEPGKAEQLADAGRIVYVDFTARWCVTCQTNKAAVFTSSEVRNWLREQDVVLLQADWTNRDDRITRALAEYGRSAIPFNLVFGPAADEPIMLPELLTPGIVLDALQRVKGG